MSIHFSRLSAFRSLLPISALLLSGCASFSPDSGMSVVSNLANATLKKDVAFVRSADDAERAGGAVRRLLSRPLTADAAVQIALLSNKGLQAAYNELALAETSLVRQSLPPNPTFSLSRIAGDGASEIERQVVGDILALATLPFRSDIERDRFRQAQLKAALETLRLAADVRRAYFRDGRGQRTRRPADGGEIDRGGDRAALPRSLARPVRSTSSIRRANRSSMPRSPRISQPPGRTRRARASG